MQPYHRPQQTVLVSNNENAISSDHPLFYVREKNYFLEQLSSKVAVQSKFNQIDLKRNVRVDHLIDRHNKINEKIEKEQKRRKMFLSSEEFVPIMGISEQQKKRRRQQKQAQKLRQQLYNNFIQQSQIHQIPQKDTQSSSDYEQFQLVKKNQQLQNFTVLSDYRSDPIRRKELYMIDLEIGKLRQEQMLQNKVKSKLESCANNQLLSKMSNTILSSYMVYFDEIFNALMDQLLEEEVVYFNGLEAGYYLGKNVEDDKNKKNRKQTNQKGQNFSKDASELASDVKAIKMMELLKCLDQLAYD